MTYSRHVEQDVPFSIVESESKLLEPGDAWRGQHPDAFFDHPHGLLGPLKVDEKEMVRRLDRRRVEAPPGIAPRVSCADQIGGGNRKRLHTSSERMADASEALNLTAPSAVESDQIFADAQPFSGAVEIGVERPQQY
jgi:hypothetical protein